MTLVLFIYSLRAGGAERVLTKLADYLVDRGHHVTVVTQAALDTDEYKTRARRVSLQAGNTSSGPVHALLNNTLRLWRLGRLLQLQRPKCMVAFMPTAAVVGLMAALPLRIPVIAAERSYPPYSGLSPWRRRLQKWLYPRAHTVTVQTEATARWYTEHDGLDNLQIIPNGIRLPLPDNQPHVAVDEVVGPQQQLVLSVGRLDAGKNTAAVLRAFAAANPRKAWHLAVIGNGPQRNEILQLAQDLSIEHCFTLLDRVGNMQQWYERAEIFISASLFEGFPNVLLEAMACGCACIAYDCPTGPADIIEPRRNGLLIPLQDEAALTAGLRELIDSPDLRMSCAQRAACITDRYDENRVFATWTELIEQAARS